MKFGVHLPHIGPFHDGESMTRFARGVEEMGYDSVWGSDHVVFPVGYESKYPYSETGDFPLPGQAPWVEEVTSLTFVAGATSRVRLGTSILVLPYRNPVMNAKTLAALDVLSGGRLICGVGAGWMREEAEAMGMPFDNRGARTDEHIELMLAMWTQDTATYEGRFYRLPPVHSEPRPVQKPHPPVWVGGHEPGALRRAARYGDCWHAYRLRPEELGERFGYVQEKAREFGRDAGSIELSVRVPLVLGDASMSIDRAVAGTVDDVKSQLAAYRDAGVETVVFEPPIFEGLERGLAVMERFAKDVAPEFA